MERSERGEWAALQTRKGDRADTWRRLDATSPEREDAVLKKTRSKATQILLGTGELYRELALSALRLVPRR